MKKKTWLVYLISECEMGSEGWSGWMYHTVAHGNTDEEIYNNWLENVKKIYDVDLSKDFKHNVGHYTNGNEYDYWSCYYRLGKTELPTSIYGHSSVIELDLASSYEKHKD